MPLSPDLAARLSLLRAIDLTTTGRRTGRPHGIEIWWFHVDGRFIITGSPGRRDWLANIRANPSVVIHAVSRDLPAKAIEVTDIEARRNVLTTPDTSWYQTQADLECLVDTAPMVEIDFS